MTTSPSRQDLETKIKDLEQQIDQCGTELQDISLELAIGISEALAGLKQIAIGNPAVRIPEASSLDLMVRLKHMVNVAARNLSEIVSLSHDFAMGLAEHFDVLNRVSKGDLSARVTGSSQVELLASLRRVTNQMVESVASEIAERKEAQQALQQAQLELESRVEERTWALAKANQQLRREIEERRRAQEELVESEAKYSTLVEHSLTGIYIDQDEKIVYANDTFAHIFGYIREELIGIAAWKLVHPEDRAFTREMRIRRLRGENVPSEYEARGLTKTGKTIWVRRSNTRVEYYGKPAILGNIVDITLQKNAQDELEKTNEDLRNFVHVVSHDLKTPIIAIQGYSARLSRLYRDALGEKGCSYVSQIARSARRMEHLVSDLLALSRVGRVPCQFASVSSAEMVNRVAAALKPRLKEKGIRLVIGTGFPSLNCDSERIERVFENLVVNAIKFSGDSPDPVIEIGYEDRGDLHCFFVKDNGIGIDPRYHHKIFEMFERLHPVDEIEGSGLGLAIVKRIVESHGGTVWVESKEGQGATFYFAVPKAPESLQSGS